MPRHAGMYFRYIPCSIPCIKYDVKISEEPPARILDFWWPNKCLCLCSLYTSLCVKLSAGGSVGICLVYVWMPNCMTVTRSRWEYNNETTEIQWIALGPCWLCSLIESDFLKTQIILSIIFCSWCFNRIVNSSKSVQELTSTRFCPAIQFHRSNLKWIKEIIWELKRNMEKCISLD